MLKLKNISKDYLTQGEPVHALKNISINFRESEFVSILGPSGCGKTTLLNIIGGLDRYTDGDLIINGKSTKDFNSNDWDSYRNHSIGFVFQSYNLIPHLSILENVEISLTLSGVKKDERKRRAKEALEKVGLGDRVNARPNQLSGGQMQRVAIARALVNNPDILLADEPTGALDSKTSVQVIDLLKEISKETLVVMVTHNPELANEYSTRIISLVDGEIVNDTNPYIINEDNDIINEDNDIQEINNLDSNIVLQDNELNKANKTKKKAKKNKTPKPKDKKRKTSMSFFTALSLSLKNLLTKKTRTLLVAFAGSIGIIGIATILAISSGFKGYIKGVEEDTLSTYPIVIENQVMDMTAALKEAQDRENNTPHEGEIASNDIFATLITSVTSGVYSNNLSSFYEYVLSNKEEIESYTSTIKTGYNTKLNIYGTDSNNKYVQVNPSKVFDNAFKKADINMPSTFTENLVVWSQMIDNRELLQSQYDIVKGTWPTNYNEVVLVVDKFEEIPDFALYALGLKSEYELVDFLNEVKSGKEVQTTPMKFSYEDILNLKYKVVLQPDLYKKVDNKYIDMSKDEEYMNKVIADGIELKVVGIIKPNEDAAAQSITGIMAYQSSLVSHIMKLTNEAKIVDEQKNNPNVDIFTGMNFVTEKLSLENLINLINNSEITDEQKMQVLGYISSLQVAGKSEREIVDMILTLVGGDANSTYEGNLRKLGVCDEDNPNSISFYPVDFASKDKIVEFIDRYNDTVKAEGNDHLVIKYTDYIGLLLSSISDVIDAISYVLFAFVAISLVVSSIMIGIITYISVLERIKEIGVLRSVGASKLDISRVFNAETAIIGFTSGTMGILITLLLLIPINLIIDALADISSVAKLPTSGALILILISVILSLIAGIIPSMIAAKKNPVECLRSE